MKKLLFDRKNISVRGDQWTAKGSFEVFTSEVEKTGPVIVADKPWEKSCLNWLTILEDNGKFRMYYEAFSDPEDDFGSRLCYAESDDLIHWQKPELGICEFDGNRNNNIIIDAKITNGMGIHGHCIFIDPNSPEKARYRCVFLGSLRRNDDSKQGFITFAYSADGIHWKHGAPEINSDYNHLPVASFGSDTQTTVLWDPTCRKYVGFFRTLTVEGCRCIGRSESVDGAHWSEPSTIISPDLYDGLNCDYYNNAATRISEEGETAWYIFYSYFNHATEKLDIRLATSRDGIIFDRYSRKPIVANDDEYCGGSLYAASGIHNLSDGRQCIAFSASNRRHCDPLLADKPSGCYMLGVFTKDRLQGLRINDYFEFTVVGNIDTCNPSVTLNADIKGEIRGGLIKENGEFLEGFSPEDCIPAKGNGTELELRWNGQCSAKETAWLKLYIKNADIWSVSMNEIPEN